MTGMRAGKADLQAIANIVLIVVALLALGRMFVFPGAGAGTAAVGVAPSSAQELSAADWRSVVSATGVAGVPARGVLLVEFVDVECPFCSRYAESLDSTAGALGKKLEVRFAHLPLPQHRFAMPGARALECARSEGKLHAMLTALLREQAQIGLKSWGEFGAQVGIVDTVALTRCVKTGQTPAIIDSGIAVAGRIGVGGTPTVVVNGWMFSTPPSPKMLVTISAGVEHGETMRTILKRLGVAEQLTR